MSWYQFRTERPAPNEADLFRMQQGQEVGALARKASGDGVLVSNGGNVTAIEATQKLIANPATTRLFEATFTDGTYTAKADILERVADGWHLMEVKSSFADTPDIKDIVDDLAYTAMVLRRVGLSVLKTSLMLISREYRYGMGPDHLFETIDKTGEVVSRLAAYEVVADGIALAILNDDRPTPSLASACRSCSFFADYCLGVGHAHTVLELPNLHRKKLQKLSAAGAVAISQVPTDFELTERQQRVRHTVLSGKMFVDPAINAALGLIEWPCHYLDFETVATVMPLYEKYGCHQQVLTQFSIHHRVAPDADDLVHTEFLADVAQSDEHALAVALIDALSGPGSIVVYSSFEKTRIDALQKQFPDLAEQLNEIASRLIDFNSMIATYIYHPEFRGSTSIKKVLPVLVPDLSYQGMAIADGEIAITKFARMARGEITGDAIHTARTQLLDYCRLDSLAMVRLHEALISVARSAHA